MFNATSLVADLRTILARVAELKPVLRDSVGVQDNLRVWMWFGQIFEGQTKLLKDILQRGPISERLDRYNRGLPAIPPQLETSQIVMNLFTATHDTAQMHAVLHAYTGWEQDDKLLGALVEWKTALAVVSRTTTDLQQVLLETIDRLRSAQPKSNFRRSN